MAEAKITFGFALNEKTKEEVIEKANEIVKRNYEINFKSTLTDEQLKKEFDKVEKLSKELKTNVNKDLSEISTFKSVTALDSLIEKLKVLSSLSEMKLIQRIKGDDGVTTTESDAFDKRGFLQNLKVDELGISKNSGLDSIDTLIANIINYKNTLDLSTNELVATIVKDASNVKSALSQFNLAINNDAEKLDNNTLANNVNSLAILNKILDDFKSIPNTNKSIANFKKYLKDNIGLSDKDIKEISGNIGKNFSEFSNIVKSAYNEQYNEAIKRGLKPSDNISGLVKGIAISSNDSDQAVENIRQQGSNIESASISLEDSLKKSSIRLLGAFQQYKNSLDSIAKGENIPNSNVAYRKNDSKYAKLFNYEELNRAINTFLSSGESGIKTIDDFYGKLKENLSKVGFSEKDINNFMTDMDNAIRKLKLKSSSSINDLQNALNLKINSKTNNSKYSKNFVQQYTKELDDRQKQLEKSVNFEPKLVTQNTNSDATNISNFEQQLNLQDKTFTYTINVNTTEATTLIEKLNTQITSLKDNLNNNNILNISTKTAFDEILKVINKLNELNKNVTLNINSEVFLKELSKIQEMINSIDTSKFKNLKIGLDPNIKINNVNSIIKGSTQGLSKIPIETDIKISKSKIENVINSFKKSNNVPKIYIDVIPKVNNKEIENLSKKIKKSLNESLSKGIVAKLNNIRYSDAIKNLNSNLKSTKLDSINVGLNFKKENLSQFITNLQNEINNSKQALNLEIKSFSATGAIDNLKQAIEDKLKEVGLNVNIKTTQIITPKTNSLSTSPSNKSNSNITTVTPVNNKNTKSSLTLLNSYEKSNQIINELITNLNKLKESNQIPVVDSKIDDNLKNLNTLITICTNNIKKLKTNFNSLNKADLTTMKNSLLTTNGIIKEIAISSKDLTNLTSKVQTLKDKVSIYKQDNYSKLSQIGVIENFENLNKDLASIHEATSLEDAFSKYDALNNKFIELQNNVKLFDTYQKQISNSKNIVGNIDNLIKKMGVNTNTKTAQSNGSVIYDDLIKLKTDIIEQSKLIEQNVNGILSNNQKPNNELLNSLLETSKELDNNINKFKILKESAKQVLGQSASSTSQTNLDNKYAKLLSNIAQYQSQNGRAMGSNYDFKSQLNSLVDEANSTDRTKENLMSLQTRFENIKGEISLLGKTGKSVGQELDNLFSKLGIKAILGTMIYRIIGYFKQMINSVKELDTSMVTLKRVTSETQSTYDEFLKNSAKNAKNLASTITEVIDAVSAFSRLGYELEDATILGNLATMYSNVGFIDIDTATSDIVSAMKAFNIEAEKASTIVDAFNDLGNKFALSSADVGSGLTESASALAVAGNDLYQATAMITGITEITQDSNSAGNALKTLSMRLRGSKADLEDAGEEIDGIANSTSKMRTEIQALSGVDIMLDETTYKSTFQIMREISKVWNDLSDINKAGLLDKLAGKTRANLNCPYVEKSA